MLILVTNLSLLSCTAEDLSDFTAEPLESSATVDGEDDKDPDEDLPPSGGGS